MAEPEAESRTQIKTEETEVEVSEVPLIQHRQKAHWRGVSHNVECHLCTMSAKLLVGIWTYGADSSTKNVFMDGHGFRIQVAQNLKSMHKESTHGQISF